MIQIQWYGVGAVALVGLAFCVLRRVQRFVAVSGVVLAAFASANYSSLSAERTAEWLLMTTGLVACVAGLSIVRVMLTRSVSLRLLARIDGTSAQQSFQDDIRDRLDDMRTWRLVRNTDAGNTLTPRGRLIADLVWASCRLLRLPT